MKCFKKHNVKAAAELRLPGYLDEVERRNKSLDDSLYCFDDADLLALGAFKTKSLPPTTQLVKNFTKAVASEVKAVIRKAPPISQEERTRRLEICHSCEFFRAEDERCSKCGCFMKYKTAWRSQHCPVGKW
jgi:hypothetical protein